ncbi:MAG TPA: TIGR03668 family PPOX class F420-dependent oxidoreductase [Candidatus Dormibacteraeota bacterium]|nr:TIGR03668 family PPOX class F420-dependent oxidoreductase [Candidatus Dormibacteraeota bacterium]
MDATAARKRLSEARVARLATVTAEGRPHLVPVVFALEGDTIYFAIDAKPKRTTDLQRLRNIAANPAVSLLADHYSDDDWTRLWWVRADGVARTVDDARKSDHALDLLARRYAQYRSARPQGPVVAITIQRITGWAAAGNPAC